jgi:hypothetical protein
MWRTWRRKFKWSHLCPVKFAGPFGTFLVMARATQPVTLSEIIDADPDCYPDIHVEYKPENWGRLNGRIVAVDYGIWDACEVLKQRKYLKSFPATHVACTSQESSRHT